MAEDISAFVEYAKHNEYQISIHTDGACSGNPGPGGWGAVLKAGTETFDLYGGEHHTTNNRMEMMAAIASISNLPHGLELNIFTDSQYLRDGILYWVPKWRSNQWRTSRNQPVKNQDLWQELDRLCLLYVIKWHWVRGHNGDVLNERADALARRAIIGQKVKAV